MNNFNEVTICKQCNDLKSLSKCHKVSLLITYKGRIKCSKCNRFCSMVTCAECEATHEQTIPIVDNSEKEINKMRLIVIIISISIISVIAIAKLILR